MNALSTLTVDSLHSGLHLEVGLVVDAEPGRGEGGEPLVADGVAAGLAGAVGALGQASEGPVDVGQLGLDLLEDRELLLPLEGIAGAVGGVLVDVGQLGGAVLLGLVSEVVVLDARAEPEQALLLVGQVAAGGVLVHGA